MVKTTKRQTVRCEGCANSHEMHQTCPSHLTSCHWPPVRTLGQPAVSLTVQGSQPRQVGPCFCPQLGGTAGRIKGAGARIRNSAHTNRFFYFLFHVCGYLCLSACMSTMCPQMLPTGHSHQGCPMCPGETEYWRDPGPGGDAKRLPAGGVANEQPC